MKNKIGIKLTTIKTNSQIVFALKKSKKFFLSYLTIYISKFNDKSSLEYALLVNKSQFKLAIHRNKVKRQLRSILATSIINGGIRMLIKPNVLYLKKSFLEIKQSINNVVKKYQNGK